VNTGVAHVTGKVKLDTNDLDASFFDLSIYPADEDWGHALSPDGTLAGNYVPDATDQTLLTFKSTRILTTGNGELEVIGILTLTRGRRTVIATLVEPSARLVSGDPFSHDETLSDGSRFPMKIRSMVGLIPLFAVEILEPEVLDRLPGFKRRLEWFIDNRPDLMENFACIPGEGKGERRLLSIANQTQLRSILKYMLDEREFLSPHGIRSLSRFHEESPYALNVNGTEHRVAYEPGESSSGLFGGNSNWRGPIWFPLNFLLVEALQKFHHYLGNDFKVEFPTGSGNLNTLWEVAGELSCRLTSIFLRDDKGCRPVFGNAAKFQTDIHWRDLVLFHEYFHGDSGHGLGSSHQTGWTGVVTKLMQQSGESRERSKS